MSAGGVAAFEKQHLWMYLRALGFEPGPAAAASGKLALHAHLGVNMFDKLNRDAFHIVSYFLFQTLDQSLTKEVFKFCWPPYDQKSDAEFRKHCCEWLKRISAECEGSFPQVVGSLLLSPGGPKFIHLMYHFARFVAIKYIKAHSKSSTLHVTEMFNVKTQDMHVSLARCHIARNRFLQVLQRKDYVIQKYEENAQLAVKQLQNLRSEYIGLQSQVKKIKPSDDQSNIKEKIEKVRSLWTLVNETLVVLEKEREVINSVLNLVNQYNLDGSNVVINIPSLLLDKIEKQMGQLHIGNVYEAGKLNLLTVVQLLNEVLKIMKYEHSNQASFSIDHHYLEKETKFQRERLSHLKQMRCKIKEDLSTIGHSIIEKQEEWKRKWKALLGVSPFTLYRGHPPAVDLLPPMCPLSFDPVSEEVYAKSILSQYPASLPDIPKQRNQEDDCQKHIDTPGAVCDIASSSASSLLQSASSSGRNNIALLEKDTVMRVSKEKGEIIPKKIPELEGQDSPLWDIAKDTENRSSGRSPPAKKSDPFQKEQDRLVEEIARAVLSNSPQISEGKEVKLEELIESIVLNPFLTRKQIPRTPENLIAEVRSSWRQAVEREDTRNREAAQMDAHLGEALPESLPVSHSQRELSMGSLFSDFSQSCLPEEKVALDCLEDVPQKGVTSSHIGEPPTDNKADCVSKKIVCKQDSECAALPARLAEASSIEGVSPAVHNRINVMMGRSKDKCIKAPEHPQPSHSETSMYKTVLWDSFQILSGISSKSLQDMDFGILHETLPEEVGRLSLNSSGSSETNFKLASNSPVYGSTFVDDVMKGRLTAPESEFSFQAIHSSYEALKKSLSKTSEEPSLSNPEVLGRHKPEVSPAAKNMQADNMLHFLDTDDLLTGCAKPSSCLSLAEGKQSLSPLIKFSPVEQKLRTAVPRGLEEPRSPLELLHNLKEEEILNKSLDVKEPDLTN